MVYGFLLHQIGTVLSTGVISSGRHDEAIRELSLGFLPGFVCCLDIGREEVLRHYNRSVAYAYPVNG